MTMNFIPYVVLNCKVIQSKLSNHFCVKDIFLQFTTSKPNFVKA